MSEQLLKRISELEDRLVKINSIIYAVGASIGSDNYFRIRHIAAETEREVRAKRTGASG